MVVVIDYGMGNLHSVSKALETVGANVVVSSDAKELKKASHIVLPGVGSFVQGKQHLENLNIIEELNEQVLVKKKPFLGVCLGMQLTATRGEEYGNSAGLNWINAKVVRFDVKSKEFKIPHMGWNDVEFIKDNLLFKGMKSPATLYFVHSYHFVPDNSDIITGVCNHSMIFTASVNSDNIYLVQFHPEKSQNNGLQILENFIKL